MRYTIEEIDLGFDAVDCEYEFEYDYSPPEPMVRYYSDGSGYPGYPGSLDLYDIKVISVCGQDGEMELTEKLRDILLQKFENYREKIEEYVGEYIFEKEEEYRYGRYE
jgi:hypothetical protein